MSYIQRTDDHDTKEKSAVEKWRFKIEVLLLVGNVIVLLCSIAVLAMG